MRMIALLLLLIMPGCALQMPRECPPGYYPHVVRTDGVPGDLGCWGADD